MTSPWVETPHAVLFRRTGAWAPKQPESQLYRQFLAFVAEAGVPDPATSLATVEQRRKGVKGQIDSEAARIQVLFYSRRLGDVHFLERLREARLADEDGSPDPADYPLLSAEVGITAGTLLGVAEAALEEWDFIAANLAVLESLRLSYHQAADAATTVEELLELTQALTWSPWEVHAVPGFALGHSDPVELELDISLSAAFAEAVPAAGQLEET